jgi:hypothetical protein
MMQKVKIPPEDGAFLILFSAENRLGIKGSHISFVFFFEVARPLTAITTLVLKTKHSQLRE